MMHTTYTQARAAQAVSGAANLQETADAVPMQTIQASPDACACEEALYYGHATQNVPAGERLLLTRYAPAGDAAPQRSINLPAGRYLIGYSVNASAMDANCPMSDPRCTVTVGIAPWINNANFPRGGSFATIRAEGSAALGSTFITTLNNKTNTVGFYNPGQQDTNYQLLNVTATRLD